MLALFAVWTLVTLPIVPNSNHETIRLYRNGIAFLEVPAPKCDFAECHVELPITQSWHPGDTLSAVAIGRDGRESEPFEYGVLETLAQRARRVGDMNGNGEFEFADALPIVRLAVGLE